jgi:hypothetical protein
MSDETKGYGEPWEMDFDGCDSDRAYLKAANGAWMFGDYDGALSRVAAARIVACVNACAGVPTAALEAGALAKALDAMDTRHRLDRSVVYRDGPDGIVSLVGGTLDHLRTVSATSAVEDALRALGRLP